MNTFVTRSIYICLCVISLITFVNAMNIGEMMLEQLSLPSAHPDEYFSNAMADQYFVNKVTAKKELEYDIHCDNIKGKICMISHTKIQKDTPIAKIQLSNLIDSNYLSNQYKNYPMLLKNPEILIAVYLLENFREPSSFIFAWFANLNSIRYSKPYAKQSPLCSPHFWSEEELSLLFPSEVQRKVKMEKESILQLYDVIHELIISQNPNAFSEVTREDWLECFLLARKYTFYSPITGVAHFLPLLAPFSHEPTSTIQVRWTEEGFFLFTDRLYAAGERIGINYWNLKGSTSLTESELLEYGIDPEVYKETKNAVLDSANQLLETGYIPKNNVAFTSVFIRCKLNFDDAITQEILKPFMKDSTFISEDLVADFRLQYNAFPTTLMRFTRLVSLSFSELTAESFEDISADKMISFDNELRTIRKVITLLQHQMAAYEADIAQFDEFEETDLRISPPAHAVFTLHKNELLVIQSVITVLQQSWKDLLSGVSDYYNSDYTILNNETEENLFLSNILLNSDIIFVGEAS